MLERPTTCPPQKLSETRKTKKWCQDNLLYWENVLLNDESSARKLNMYRNEALYFRGEMSREEIARICNPHNIPDFTIPPGFRNYPICEPRIQTLLGEEIKRLFNYKVFVTNRDAVSDKEEKKKDLFMQFVAEQIQAEAVDEESMQKDMEKLQEYLAYDFQDLREKTASELLRHYTNYLDLKIKFSKIWLDYLLYGEMIINNDCINGKPYAEREDPKNIFWNGSEQYPYIDDADAVIKEVYMPLGRVIDHYYEYLSDSDIKKLEEKRDALQNKQFTLGQMYTKDGETGSLIPDSTMITVYGDNELPNHKNFSGYYNENGEVRVCELRWKSFKKVGKLNYIDENGDEQETWVDEYYTPIDNEVVKWYWINEAWECTRIGDDIIVKYGPRKVQFRKMDNKSYCSLGYTGTFTEKIWFDIVKEYQIKYNAYMYRTEQAMIKAVGKIGILDLAMIPDNWTVDMAMYYATTMGWMVVDSFKEAKLGPATGKLAGQMATRGDAINLEQGQFISQNIQMLQYIEQQLDLVTGVNYSRRGEVKATTGLGVMQEAQEASASITESHFTLLDNVKIRTLSAILEIAKYALRNKTESIQYVTSEMTSKIFEIDGELLNEAEYGLLVGNAVQDAQAIQTLQRATEIALQTGEVDLIQLMDIFSNESTSEIKRRIQKSVNQKREAAAQQAETDRQTEQAKLQTQLALKEADALEKEKDRALKKYEIDTNNQTAIYTAELKALGFSQETDADMNGVPDVMEQADLALKGLKIQQDAGIKTEQIKQKAKEHKDKLDIENKKLKLKEKELEQKKIDSENKLKIARENKTKAEMARKRAK